MKQTYPPVRRIIRAACRFGGSALAVGLSLAVGADTVPRTEEGFRIPADPAALVFPRAHGSHPDFQLEWWYLTGHLHAADGRRFGFQSTFFRRARDAAADDTARVSSAAFGHDQIYLAHMALLDAASGQYFSSERLNREGWDAGAARAGLRVWNGNWSLVMTDEARRWMRLYGDVDNRASLSLELQPLKPKVLFGRDGISLKGALPTSRSYYITFSRLQAAGTVVVDGAHIPVTGLAWMDHEISSGQLAPGQVGWDWCAVQLHDGREIMAFRLRREDGTADPYSYLAWVDEEGKLTHARWGEWTWHAAGEWESPHTGARYPLDITLATVDPESGESRRLRLEPLARDQEFNGPRGGISYWEGACRVFDEAGAEVGSAYVELTGYAGDLGGRL